MAWDLKLSENGDLVFGPNRDLLGVSGHELTNQRVILRLRLPRGSFIFDKNKDLGSNLYNILRHSHGLTTELTPQVTAFVREALMPMDDIQVQEVHVEQIPEGGYKSIKLQVDYIPVITSGETSSPLIQAAPAQSVAYNI